MYRKIISSSVMLFLGSAAMLATLGCGQAAARGGGHGGGGGHVGGAHFAGAGFHSGHVGGAHFGGYHGSSYRGGRYAHPYAHNGYHSHFGTYGYAHDHHTRYGGYWAYPYSGYYGGYGSYPYYDYGSDPYVDDWSSGFGDAGYYGSYGNAAVGYAADTGFGAAPSSSEPDDTAHITVDVPANARLWFDNTPVKSTGLVREFNSPPLAPGKEYTYQIRASWNDNGREVMQTQAIAFTARTHIHVAFPIPSKSSGS